MFLSIMAWGHSTDRQLMGSPVYALAVPERDASNDELGYAQLSEIRPNEERASILSGVRLRALVKLPRGIEVQAYALAGFEISAKKIDAQTIYVLDQRRRLWRADLGEALGDSVPKVTLELVPGQFLALQTEGSGEVFAMDEKGRLTMLTSSGPVETSRRLAIALQPGESILSIHGTLSTGLHVLTDRHRVIFADRGAANNQLMTLPGYSLHDESFAMPKELRDSLFHGDSAWDVRGNPNSGDFWLLDEKASSVWIKTKANLEGERFWVKYDLTDNLSDANGGNKIQILGVDARALYLKAGKDYVCIHRVSESPRAFKSTILGPNFFTSDLLSRGIFGGLFMKVLFLQPSEADRGNTVRYDMHVRNISLRDAETSRVHGLVEDYVEFVNRNARHVDHIDGAVLRETMLDEIYGTDRVVREQRGERLTPNQDQLGALDRWRKIYGTAAKAPPPKAAAPRSTASRDDRASVVPMGIDPENCRRHL